MRQTRFPHPYFSRSASWKWFILLNVLVGATMSALDVSIVNVAMPTLKAEFDTSMAVIEWVAMAYMLTLTVFLPFFGRLADVFGRSRLYTVGFVVFTVGSALCGAAGSAAQMIGARVLQAVGAGLLQANSVALITQAFPGSERGKAIGIQGAVQAIAMAAGPFVGGVLIASVGWRAVFLVNIPIGILGIAAALYVLPADARPTRKERIDTVGTVLFAAGLAALVLAFNDVERLGWGSPVVLACFAGGLVLLALFVWAELTVEHPLIDLALFRNGTFLVGNVTGMMSYYVLFAVLFLMPFYFEKVLGYGPALAGALLTPIPLAMALVAPFAGHLSDRHGARVMTAAGMLVSALACSALLFLGSSSRLPLLVGELILLGVGMGMFTPPNNSAIMGAAPKEKLGVAGGILNMMRSLGLIFGVDISGLIFGKLEHRYLSERGYPAVRHVFRDARIPLAAKHHAFMRGFVAVVLVLMVINLVAAVLSFARRGAKVDAAAAEAAKEYVDLA